MCGRTRQTLGEEQVLHAAGARRWVDRQQYQPSYNAAPGFPAPVVRAEGDETVVHTMRWGLVPSFTKLNDKPDYWRMFNARSESLAEKPSFRRLVPSKRCLVLAEGFYEWQKEKGGRKQPYYIHLSSGEPLVMAGLWDVWQSADSPVHTYTILTTDASKRLEWLHDRMPVILRDREAQQTWLRTDDKATLGTLQKLYAPYNGEDLVWYQVTPQMNTPAFQGPQCCEEVKKPSPASFFKPRSSAAGAKAAAQQDAGTSKEQGAAEVKAEPGLKEEEGAAGAATEVVAAEPASASAAMVKQEQEGEQRLQQDAEGGAGPEQQQQGGAAAAAVNADEQPREHQAAGTAAAVGEQATDAAPASPVPPQPQQGQQQGTPQKRRQPGSGGGKASGGGKGGSAKKAKLPGQKDITQFFKK